MATLEEALQQYGFLGRLAGSVPELGGLLKKAADEDWTPQKFQYAVEDSKWWTSTADTRRQAAILQSSDPATWNQNVANATYNVHQIMNELGISMPKVGWAQDMAYRAITQGWDEATLREGIASYGAKFKVGEGGHLQGSAAEMEAKLMEVASSYGVPYSKDGIRGNVMSILQGNNTLADYDALFRQRAKTTYPQFAQELDSGLTVRDIADPYVATMAQTLEISEGDINLYDPIIKRALTNRDATNKPSTTPLWEFEQSVKKDPRWDKTKNAAQSASALMQQVGTDWGFIG